MNEQSTPEQLPPARLVALHLAPGAIATALFVVLADPVQQAGYPPLLALLLALAVGIVPFELAIIALAARRESGEHGLLAAVRYRRPMPARSWLTLLPATLVASIVGFGVLSLADTAIRDALLAGCRPRIASWSTPMPSATTRPRHGWRPWQPTWRSTSSSVRSSRSCTSAATSCRA